jgi:hypothetical protein
MFELLGGALLFGSGLLFWILVIAFFIATECSVSWKSHLGFLWLGILLAALTIFSTFNPFVWIWANPWIFLFAVVIYIIAGISWAFGKWWFYLNDAKDRIGAETLAGYRKKYEAGDSVDVKGYSSFLDYLQKRSLAPKASNEVDLISVWGAWWPFSMFESAFNDIIRRGWNWLVRKYIKTFDNITARVFK